MPGFAQTRAQHTRETRAQTIRRNDVREQRRAPGTRRANAQARADGARITSIEAYIADRRTRDERSAFVETVLGRLARHRTGSDAVDAAFERNELRRIRGFLAFASEAKSQVVRAANSKGPQV